jgi:transcription initiation factor TFIIB
LTYVSKIAEKNGISGKTQGVAIAILGEAKLKRFSAGKDPMGMAAAAIYIACLQQNEKITQKDIAEVAGVTEVTVRNRYKELKRQLNLEIPIERFVYRNSDNKPSFPNKQGKLN